MSAEPLLRYQLSSSLQFHVAAAVNALSDIPILSSLDSISSGSHSSFVLHWLNNKEIQFTMAAESCLGAPVLALEVQSVDVSDDSSLSDSEAELLMPSDDDILDSPKRKYLPESFQKGKFSQFFYCLNNTLTSFKTQPIRSINCTICGSVKQTSIKLHEFANFSKA